MGAEGLDDLDLASSSNPSPYAQPQDREMSPKSQ